MTAVFADTFYFLALVNPKDRCHAQAVASAVAFNGTIVTSTWILMEVGDALSREADRSTFLRLLDDLAKDTAAVVVSATQEVFEKAKALFAARSDKDWSMTDCTSFVIMKERGLTEAFTGDRHFERV